jgi:hypothetical protein
VATIQEVLTHIVQSINGYVSDDLAGVIASLDEPAPAPEATPVPAPAQPSEPDTPNPAFGSESEPLAADMPAEVASPNPEPMGG